MVKLAILLGLALATCVFAIPTLKNNTTETTANIVPPCLCSNTTGLFCGERSTGKNTNEPISGFCNATSLFFCSQWAIKTGGMADLVQGPCWTKKCYQSPKLGEDSCQPIAVNSTKSAASVKSATAVRSDETVKPSNSVKPTKPVKSTKPGKSIKPAHPTSHAKRAVPPVTSTTLTPFILADCACGNLTGHFCGGRTSRANGYLHGYCNPFSLYYCSPWAVKTSSLADQVQRPCWTKQCYQAKIPGSDSCNALESELIGKREDAAEKKKPDVKSKHPPSNMSEREEVQSNTNLTSKPALGTECRCGLMRGSSCHCDEAGVKPQVEHSTCPCCKSNPVRTGSDHCSHLVEKAEDGVESDSKHKLGSSKPALKATSASILQPLVQTRKPASKAMPTSVLIARNDLVDGSDAKTKVKGKTSISKSSPASAATSLVRTKQTVLKAPSMTALAAKNELFQDSETKAKPHCKCGGISGWFCGARIALPAYMNITKSLSGECKSDVLYYCDKSTSKGHGEAEALSKKLDTDHCYYDFNNFGRDRYKHFELDDHSHLNEMIYSRASAITTIEANPLPVCTCGKDSGFFCGDRATAAVKKDEHRALSGNCTVGALYYCESSILAIPQTAKEWESPCKNETSSKCYQSVETGFDSCHH